MATTKWFERTAKKIQEGTKPTEVPKGMWEKCPACSNMIFKEELEANLHVCPKCDHHFRINSAQRIEMLCDKGSFREFNRHLTSSDPLGFASIGESYKDKVKTAMSKSKLNEAVVTGTASINRLKVVMAIMDFRFFGGSMASVVGEKITRAIEKALHLKKPIIIISTSGGARMQEGILSLMQMAKTSAALEQLHQAHIPYISLLTDPTTGGVTASYAMLGDLNIAEPGALIGFAGPRVIEQTIKQKLPKGFQRSEFLLEHGFIDAIIHRKELKDKITVILKYLS